MARSALVSLYGRDRSRVSQEEHDTPVHNIYPSFFIPIFLRACRLRKALTKIQELKAPRNDLRVSVSLVQYLGIRKVGNGQYLGILLGAK